MSDRTSAGIFADMFVLLRGHVDRGTITKEAGQLMAEHLWSMTGGYDFSSYQLEADEVLASFGLMKRKVSPEYPEEGPVRMYKGDDYFDD